MFFNSSVYNLKISPGKLDTVISGPLNILGIIFFIKLSPLFFCLAQNTEFYREMTKGIVILH